MVKFSEVHGEAYFCFVVQTNRGKRRQKCPLTSTLSSTKSVEDIITVN